MRCLRLAEIASNPDRMEAGLARLASGTTGRTAIHIDAVDEAMIPLATTSLLLSRWIREDLGQTRPLLRITCRSAVWPRPVQAAIELAYGAEAITVGSLQPIDDADVIHIAEFEKVNGESFLAEIRRSNVATLCQQPLTLRMLLDLYKKHGGLPTTRRELFSRAVDLLAHERDERRELGTVADIPARDLVEAAERLACFLVLSGAEAVDLADASGASSLGFRELAALPGTGRALDDPLLRALGRSGLCEGEGPNRFRFVHRQVAEYLAGRRLARLLPHQSRSLLSSGLGWRAGVAGPLRETAAFAATESPSVARWLAETDPEVIGLSEVADDDLRRQATLGLLERFRARRLTDALLDREEMPLAGLEYPGAEADLRPVLKEREEGCEDVLELAVDLVGSWRLDSLHADLADLVLDDDAPFHPRVSAGYALARRGSREVKRRLKPLVAGGPRDPDDELKGLALRCCWPEDLSTAELLEVLEPWGSRRLHGAYFGFLIGLDQQAFAADDDRLGGLRWSRSVLRPGPNSDPDFRIVQRIARGALDALDDPAIASALVDLLLKADAVHSDSPLKAIRHGWSGAGADVAMSSPLLGRTRERRILLDRLTAAGNEGQLWCLASASPGLLDLEDFPWLLERACDPSRPFDERERFADLARMLPMHESSEAVESWLHSREQEPVRTRLAYPVCMALDSDEARRSKDAHDRSLRRQGPTRLSRIEPPPGERVRRVLEWAETKDWRFFFRLCRELTLGEEATHYGFQRFLTRTPGWRAADAETRGRITDAARMVLSSPTDDPEACREIPLNSILTGYMEAIWLLFERDRAWLERLPHEWWSRWCWLLIREIHPLLGDEPGDEKSSFFRFLYTRAAGPVRDAIETIALAQGEGSESLLIGLLGLCEMVQDDDLDTRLERVMVGAIDVPNRVWHLAPFLLRRRPERAMASCRMLLDGVRTDIPRDGPEDARAAEVASALLHDRTPESCQLALSFLDDRPDLARRVLSGYAHSEPSERKRSGEPRHGATAAQLGRLLELLFMHYPPESDARHLGAYFVTEEDSAVQLRDELLRWLCAQRSAEALGAARRLEQRFGARYTWLRRPRSVVERAYRQWLWSPVPPATVASLLADGEKRLIRSERDAADGLVAAIELYGWNLRHASPSPLEDLWNTPSGGDPSPKSEERISDKLCESIRAYFQEHAVVADREVQVFRRSVRREHGGAPGSEVDVLVRVPGLGMAGDDPIAIPLEVKRSSNREVRTGLREQLVGRYMSQLGTSYGVFVVVWLDAPGLSETHRPVWTDIGRARAVLAEQVRATVEESGDTVHVSAVVVDASLA